MIDIVQQKELRGKFNPEGSNLRKMQLRMLDMLKYLDKICADNDIRYWLSSGTCLGAVRHGGFIPWDDDCDIEMFRSDYKKLEKILKSQPHPNYILHDSKCDPEYIQIFPKLRDLRSNLKEENHSDDWTKYKGIYIDIFILDPSNSRFLFRASKFLWTRLVVKSVLIKNRLLRKICRGLSRSVLTGLIFPIFRLLSTNSERFRHCLGSYFVKPRFKRDFDSSIRMPFEGDLYPVPVGYDNYLRTLYGDYMKLPNIEDIHPHAGFLEIYDDPKENESNKTAGV